MRLLDIRLALRDEYIADLSHCREENADIMKVSCMKNLENSFASDVPCEVDYGEGGGGGGGGGGDGGGDWDWGDGGVVSGVQQVNTKYRKI